MFLTVNFTLVEIYFYAFIVHSLRLIKPLNNYCEQWTTYLLHTYNQKRNISTSNETRLMQLIKHKNVRIRIIYPVENFQQFPLPTTDLTLAGVKKK